MKKLRRVHIIEKTEDMIPAEGVLNLLKTADGFKAGNYLIEDLSTVGHAYLEKVYNRVIGEPLIIKECEHIRLQELSKKDADELYHIMLKKEVREFADDIPDTYEVFLDKLDQYRLSYEFYDCGLWGIFEKTTNRLIGECGIQYSEIEGKDVLELGYFLSPEFSGLGYACESARAALDYAHDVLCKTEVCARVRNDNRRSIALLTRLGFRRYKDLNQKDHSLYMIDLDKRNEVASENSSAGGAASGNENGPLEIEKKYLINTMPDLTKYEHHVIEQAYLNRDPVLRIRKKDDKYIFTFKSKLKTDGDLQVSREIEEPLTASAYEHLLKKIDGYPITKTRYIIPLPEGKTGELDVFEGRLTGLVFMEIEFASIEEAEKYKVPEWVGKDVTADKRYRNGYLSTLDKYKGFDP